MAAGDTLQGRRLPDKTNVNDWMHGADGGEQPAQPGEYIVNPNRDAVWVCLPNGTPVRVPIKDGHGEVVWGFEEHDDGTITLGPSIRLHPTPGLHEGWHGFLERGVWREV